MSSIQTPEASGTSLLDVTPVSLEIVAAGVASRFR